ncbi:hypothetical protein DVH24_033601 [Malus domestica]|uniref:t-SNARE coiled-coil homology domain-containing protein n=1 Tax=Malus domestica TaxID=3750 RepID=A0A498JCY1_MALDO|nr:hypothetical protein DVH24_033601 [Malus domestica]
MAGYGNVVPYRSREGLNPRPATNMDEIQLRIDPMYADLDEDIKGLHNQVAQVIGTEAKFQNEFLDQLVCYHTLDIVACIFHFILNYRG